jgi:DNA-binding NarL/FixJ family response regulator
MRISKTRLKVLVVDDQFIMRTIISKQIEEFLKNKIKHEVITAEGPEQSLKMTSENNIDIVFTDLQMAGDHKAGYRLTRKIKARHPDTRVFIASNTIATYLESDARDAGASGCIQLPLEQTHLERAFCGYL